MTNEEAIWTLENGAWWDSLPDDISDADKNPLISAIELAVDALKGHTGEPLTIEQLLEMDGEPVWIFRLEDQKGWWAVIYPGKKVANTDYGGYFDFEDYGKTWLAYRYTPVKLDAWTAQWKDFRGKPKCSMCNSVFPEEYFQRPFCPKCGRPLTPEARTMLEKRLRGARR